MKIAISCYSGSGATTVVNLLSSQYNLTPINYTFRNLAVDMRIPFEELRRKAEGTPYYDYVLDSKLLEFIKADNWIMASRLAIWLADSADKRIWLECPIEERARRVAERENWTYEQALEHTQKRDELDKARYLALYGIDLDNHNFVDNVISTLDTPEAIVEKILASKTRNLKTEIPNINEIVTRRLTEFK